MANSVANVVFSRLRLKSVTVKAWAKANSHRPDTVFKSLYGNQGKADRGESLKIKEVLCRDGYWPEEEEGTVAVNSSASRRIRKGCQRDVDVGGLDAMDAGFDFASPIRSTALIVSPRLSSSMARLMSAKG